MTSRERIFLKWVLQNETKVTIKHVPKEQDFMLQDMIEQGFLSVGPGNKLFLTHFGESQIT